MGALILSAVQTLIICILNLSIVKKLGLSPLPKLLILILRLCRTAILALDGMSVAPDARSWTSLRAMFLPLINAFTVLEIHCSLQSSAGS